MKFSPALLHRWRLTNSRFSDGAGGGGETFGYEGQQGEAKPESSETVNLVNWQAKGDGSDMKDGSLRVSNVKRGKQKPSEH